MAASRGCWLNRRQRWTPVGSVRVWVISVSKRCAALTRRCALCWISSRVGIALGTKALVHKGIGPLTQQMRMATLTGNPPYSVRP